MENQLDLAKLIELGIEHYQDIAKEVAAKIDQLTLEALEKDGGGRATTRARNAVQALRNPTLNTTHVARARQQADAALNDAIALAVSKAKDALPSLIALLAASQTARLFEGAAPTQGRPSRKRTPRPDELGSEEWRLIWELRRRDVPPSAFDALNDDELALISWLIVDKARDPGHRNPRGPWIGIFQAGFLEFAVGNMPRDEREAILAATNMISEDGILARDQLEEKAGRSLEITDTFAAALIELTTEHNYWEVSAFEKNRMTAAQLRHEEDVQLVLKCLGLSEEERERAEAVLDPEMLRQRQALQGREPRSIARPANARVPSSLSAMAEAGSDDELPSHEDLDEAAAIRIAERLVDCLPHLDGAIWGGTGLPMGTVDPAQLIPALERMIELGKGDDLKKRFLTAARQDQTSEFIAEERQKMIADWAQRLRDGDEFVLKRARGQDLVR